MAQQQILKGTIYILSATESILCAPINGRLLGRIVVSKLNPSSKLPLLYKAEIDDIEIGQYDNRAGAIRAILLESEFRIVVDSIVMITVDLSVGGSTSVNSNQP